MPKHKAFIHKMDRNLAAKTEKIRCSGKSCDFSEHVSYYWKNVECPKCLKLRISYHLRK